MDNTDDNPAAFSFPLRGFVGGNALTIANRHDVTLLVIPVHIATLEHPPQQGLAAGVAGAAGPPGDWLDENVGAGAVADNPDWLNIDMVMNTMVAKAKARTPKQDPDEYVDFRPGGGNG